MDQGYVVFESATYSECRDDIFPYERKFYSSLEAAEKRVAEYGAQQQFICPSGGKFSNGDGDDVEFKLRTHPAVLIDGKIYIFATTLEGEEVVV